MGNYRRYRFCYELAGYVLRVTPAQTNPQPVYS